MSNSCWLISVFFSDSFVIHKRPQSGPPEFGPLRHLRGRRGGASVQEGSPRCPIPVFSCTPLLGWRSVGRSHGVTVPVMTPCFPGRVLLCTAGSRVLSSPLQSLPPAARMLLHSSCVLLAWLCVPTLFLLNFLAGLGRLCAVPVTLGGAERASRILTCTDLCAW